MFKQFPQPSQCYRKDLQFPEYPVIDSLADFKGEYSLSTSLF